MTNYTHHKDYKTCNSCGANLDHGETCECEDHGETCECEDHGETCECEGRCEDHGESCRCIKRNRVQYR